MDPQQTLADAEVCRLDDPYQCSELLKAYFQWRIAGGFEPYDGDRTAFDLLSRLAQKTVELMDILTEHELL